jgi:chromosome segregation ATPase
MAEQNTPLEGEGTTQTAAAAQSGGGEGFEPITSQEEFDRRIRARIARVKATPPADYEELKAKAARLDELEEANKTELEKAEEARAKAEEELNALKAERAHAEMVAAVAAKTGVGADVVSMLTGDTAEELEAQVERLAGTIPAFPVRTDDGGGKAHAARTNGDVFAEQAARMFKQ